jgi:hypothetical protein
LPTFSMPQFSKKASQKSKPNQEKEEAAEI